VALIMSRPSAAEETAMLAKEQMTGNQLDGFQHLTFSVSGETYLYGRQNQNTVVRVIAVGGEMFHSAPGELRAAIRTIAKAC